MKYKVMIDANILIYTFLDVNTAQKEKIKNLFISKNIYQFVTTTRIIDEAIFKLIVISSGKKLKQLKKDKNKLKEYVYIIELLKSFLKDYDFKIYEITQKHYWKLPKIIEEFGLLGNDALTMAIMKENNLKYIATFDKDFAKTHLQNIFDVI